MPKNSRASAEGVSYSEMRYRRLFEAARDGILIVDPETRQILDVNPFLIEFLGYSYEEFVGKELFEIGLLRDEAASQAAFRELQENGYIRYDDLPLRTRDGRPVEVEFVSNIYQEGDRQVIQCNVRDISARVASEAALRQSEERFKLVSRAVSDVMWDWNLVVDDRWWSGELSTTFGYAADEIEPGNRSWTSRIHPDDAERVIEGVHRSIADGAESWAAEYRFRRRDGTYAVVADNGYILRDASGGGVRMVGGLRDLTEQKRIEAQSLRNQRMESIGTLAGGIAHDLNNVLAPILMSIDLLKLDPGIDTRRLEILDTIHGCCRRGADLVRQVLSFARGVDGERIPIRLRHVINEFRGLISETFPRDLKIVCDVEAELWLVAGDPTQLHQILLNLAVNARDAMLQGGTLTITASNVTIDAQYTALAPEFSVGRYVLLQVRDTGAGIPPEIRERIFEPFFTTKGVGKGSGLGLATVHSIVKSHGGFVVVESEPGAGTTFKVYLPADLTQACVETVPPLQAGVVRGRDELVLVVDDEVSIREVTRQTLEAFGYRVILAGNGAEAIARYAEQGQQVALVLIDRMMPVMDGVAAIKVLRSINPRVKVIASSGFDSGRPAADDREEGHVLLAKPYSAQTLVRLVRDVIDRPAIAPS